MAIAHITGMGLIIGEVARGGTGCRAIGSIGEVIATGFTVAMSHGIGIIGIFAGTRVIIKRLQISPGANLNDRRRMDAPCGATVNVGAAVGAQSAGVAERRRPQKINPGADIRHDRASARTLVHKNNLDSFLRTP